MTAPVVLYPSLDRKRLIREAAAGRLRHTASGYDLWDRRGAVKPARVDLAALIAAGWLQLRPDNHWRPTVSGAAVANLNP